MTRLDNTSRRAGGPAATIPMREIFDLPSRELLSERWRALRAVPHPEPVFMFGNQKAGSTAIAALLASATGKRATLDLPGTKAPYFARLTRGQTPLERFVAQNAFSFSAPIIKDGSLTFVAEELMAYFAVPRAIFILRSPLDNIRSILDRLKLPGNLETLDARNVRINATWREILAGEDLGFTPDHYIAILARRWQRAAEIYERNPDRYVRIRYEDFRADKIAEIRRLADAFALPAPHDISALLECDFQRRGNPDTDLRAFFGPENFQRIVDICGESAARQGYALV